MLQFSYISYFKGTLKDIAIFAIVIIIFYDVSSFHLAYFGYVTHIIPENAALLKIKITGEQKLSKKTSLTPHERGLKVYFIFLIPLCMLYPLLILLFWNLIFGKHILSCWLYQYLKSRWYGSHEILRKFIELFFFTHTSRQACLNVLVFYNFVRGGGRGRFLLPENTVFTIFKIAVSCWSFLFLETCYMINNMPESFWVWCHMKIISTPYDAKFSVFVEFPWFPSFRLWA